MQRITPWAFHDAAGVLHLDVRLLLRAMDVADTPENREVCAALALAVLEEAHPELPIAITE